MWDFLEGGGGGVGWGMAVRDGGTVRGFVLVFVFVGGDGDEGGGDSAL